MRQVVHLLINPLVHFWIFLLIGLLLYWRSARKTATVFVGYAIFWLFLTSVSPVSVYLAKQREVRYPVLWQIPDSLQFPHVLILGAGFSNAPSLSANNRLAYATSSRLNEGIRLYHQYPGAKLIGSGNSSDGRTAQAEAVMNAAVTLGISPADTLQSTTPFNTETEAIAYAQRFGTKQPLILVTSALHMPRALFWFRQQGIEAIPAPTDHYIKPDPEKSPYNWKPSAQKIEITAALLHEWVGMLYAKIKTRGSNKNAPRRAKSQKDS